jgi:hypothetical protein
MNEIFDIKDPIRMTFFSVSISFIFMICVFYLFTPSCVQIINTKTGKNILSWKLIIIYSLTSSFVISSGVLLYYSNKNFNTDSKIPTFPINMEFPSNLIADAYVSG